MMKTMKRCLCLLPLAGALACAADLAGVHSVYLLPMARGMDQYLANRLAGGHVFEVVTDPKLADAVFTDRLGQGFERQLEDFSPTPKSPEPAPKSPEPTAKPADGGAGSAAAGFGGETVNKLTNPGLNSSFGRARGTVFLVDAKSRQVIWSVYAPPRDFAGKELNRTASDIVSRLKRDLNPKK